MSVTLAPESLRQPALHSFISGVGDRAAGALAQLRIGLPLRLRRVAKPVRGFSIEIVTEAGAALGHCRGRTRRLWKRSASHPKPLPLA